MAIFKIYEQQQHHILVVDDESDIITVLEHLLQIIGFNICGFTNPHLALEHFKANSKDHSLVHSDLAMPNMCGFELARKIRSIGLITMILILTASDVSNSDLLRDLTSSLKIDGFIQKPIPLQSLKHIIQKHFAVSI